MRGVYCIQRCHRNSLLRYPLHDIQRPFHLSLLRRYANRQSPPGFSANQPSSPGPRPFKAKSTPFDPNKISKEAPNAFRENISDGSSKAKPPRRFRIGPGKVILFSIAAFLGYKVYTWQTDPHRSVILNPKFFTPFILEAREKVSPTSSILSLLSVPKGQNTENVAEAWETGVWSVQVMQPELQIARAYTPLPPSDDAEPEQLRLFVRQEPQGEVSTFLHKINRGTLVHLRGPHLEYEIPKDVDEVLFIAGGTGIAPALQVAHTLYKHRVASSEDGPKLRILWANRRREDSFQGLEPTGLRTFAPKQLQEGLLPKLQGLADKWQGKRDVQSEETMSEAPTPEPLSQHRLVEEVESLKSTYQGKVSIDYFIDEKGSHITESLLRRYLSTAAPSEQFIEDGSAPKKIILVSGPEGFVSSYAGAKSMKGGKEIQGPLGGILKKIDSKGWDIWKL